MVSNLWRFFVGDGDTCWVARDDTEGRPEHLAHDAEGRLVWKPHPDGGEVEIMPISDFVAYLDQGGR